MARPPRRCEDRWGMTDFSVSVECRAGDVPHKHVVVVRPGAGGVHGAALPTPVRLHYRCPVTGQDLKLRFTPPVGSPRPFTVIEVRDG